MLRLAEAYSTLTLAHSQPSSSATIIGSEVRTPSPISDWATRIVTVSSGSIRSHALASAAPGGGDRSQGAGSSGAAPARPGNATPTASPPAAVRVVTRKWRRLSGAPVVLTAVASPSRLHQRGRAVDRGADARVGAAAADVGDRLVDLSVGRLGLALKECHNGHDLARLAVAALWHVLRHPGPLHRMVAGGREALDRGDARPLDVADLDRAGGHGLAVDVDGASAALGDAAAIFGAGQPEL